MVRRGSQVLDFRLPIFDLGKHMHKTLLKLFLNSCSDNLKPVLSKVERPKTCTAFDKLRPRPCRGEPRRSMENLKWLGLSVIVFVLVVTGAVAQAQQPKKVYRIGYLS